MGNFVDADCELLFKFKNPASNYPLARVTIDRALATVLHYRHVKQ